MQGKTCNLLRGIMYGHGGLTQGASGHGGHSDHIGLPPHTHACKVVRQVTDIQEVQSAGHCKRLQAEENQITRGGQSRCEPHSCGAPGEYPGPQDVRPDLDLYTSTAPTMRGIKNLGSS